jgi:hypothetical protein
MKALDVNADADATAVLTFAIDTSIVNGVPGKPDQRKSQLHPYVAEQLDAMAGRAAA